MNDPRAFPDWENLYRQEVVEKLPWYWPTLDPDLEAALVRHGVTGGRALDQGTGPGTQAIALAGRGFQVTATDVSTPALGYAANKAKSAGVAVTFVQDDALATQLTGSFDLIFDRGCFHVLSPERHSTYVEAMHRLLAPDGWLFLKTFSHHQPGTQGPHRFTPEQMRQIFGEGEGFEVIDLLDTVYQGQLDPFPKALFATIRRR